MRCCRGRQRGCKQGADLVYARAFVDMHTMHVNLPMQCTLYRSCGQYCVLTEGNCHKQTHVVLQSRVQAGVCGISRVAEMRSSESYRPP